MDASNATTTAFAAANDQPSTMKEDAAHSRFRGRPYLQCLKSLENAFPALKTFFENISKENDHGREIVTAHYQREQHRAPGRCYCLKFEDKSVSTVNETGFESPSALREYLSMNPAKESREAKHRRLFILEDMEPDYVDALGHHLGVDPLVFSEQMNTWNFTDSRSIPHRGLPSMSAPQQSFTLRYYELRTILDPKSLDVLTMQMTFAVNRRRYERWRDIDVPSAGKPDLRHAFVRRNSSFWTSQDPTREKSPPNGVLGWDAVILVDPAFAATCKEVQKSAGYATPALPVASTKDAAITTSAREVLREQRTEEQATRPPHIQTTPSADGDMEECLILSNPKKYHDRASLWKAQDWDTALTLKATKHKSRPYHDGCSTLARLMFSHVGIGAQEANIPTFRAKRNLVSPLDEMVFYWTKIATPELINQTNEQSSNAAYYLLKHVAQHWVNQLELVNTTIAKGEWLSDDYQAKIDDGLSSKKWKAELIKVNEISKDINYMRRHLNHFWRSMVLNLERLGVQLGAEGIDNNTSLALQGAQKDFLTIHARMQPLRDRAEALVSVSNDLANLRAAFRGVQDSEFGLRLSLFASTIFPLTLVASIFSMSSDYQPGKPHFWKLWAIGPPFCIAIALGMIYGTRPWMVFFDIGEVLTTMAAWLTHHDLTTVKDGTAGYKQKSEAEKTPVMKKDEEHG